MDQSIITRYGTVVTRLTMFKFQHSELVFESEKSKHNLFHGVIEKNLVALCLIQRILYLKTIYIMKTAMRKLHHCFHMMRSNKLFLGFNQNNMLTIFSIKEICRNNYEIFFL